jgi:hypothetical protein
VNGAVHIDIGIRDLLLPSVVDKLCTNEHAELARGLFQSVEAAFEVTHFGRTIRESEGLADVHVLLDGSVEERSVNVELTHVKVAGGRDGEKETKTGHADERGERFREVEANTLVATFGDESCFEPGGIS